MRLFDLYFLIASILFLVAPSFGQRIFTYEFKHGENDKYYGRLSYQIVTTINGEEIPLDNKAVIISTENSEDESLVTILINSVELAYKDKSYSSNSQDREAEVFYLGFEEPKAPLGGSIEYISVQKIYDRGTNIGATKTKVVYKFICNKTIIAQSSINLSFKTFFAPRGRNEIFDSRVYQITIPVTIEPSKSAYVNQLRLEKAFDRYKQLSIELGNDPKRKNIPLFENIKKYLSEYKDIKHQKMNELAEVVNQYENRTVGSEEVYDRILRYKEADMLQKAASDINLYVNNCVQKIWVDCPEFENVRYLELKLGKSDTTMLRGFLNKFPSDEI